MTILLYTHNKQTILETHNVKKANNILFKLVLVVLLILPVSNTFAQLTRIAVVNIMDTTLVHIHLGTTIFTNKTDTFDLQFNCKKYIEQELPRFLSSKYEVSVINIPDSILSKNGSIYDFWGIKKEIKSWISSYKDKYDLIIYVESSKGQTSGYPANHKLLSSGLYSQGNPIRSWAAVYSTMSFTAFYTSNAKTIDYNTGYMLNFKTLKNFKFSKDKITIEPEMIPLIKAQLKKILDDVLENFLTNSYIVPKDAYDSVKSLKTE